MLCSIVLLAALAGPEDFRPGPVIAAYGKIADVPGAAAVPKDQVFKIRFDITEAAESGKVSRRLEAAARLINMHAAAGVPVENTQLALVIHGKAHRDLVRGSRSEGLVAALVKSGVRIELCGQTATYYGVRKEDLLPGVKMNLSAMTAHALLQKEGYVLNPF